jgi:holo-[acyl-carrier protein] synthase
MGAPVGIGVDIVDISRFEQAMSRTPGIVGRIFTPREIAQAGGERPRPAFLAGRWAAKEAVAKVLVDTRGLEWHDCEVASGDRGEPVLRLTGTVATAAAARGIRQWHLSLSHDGGMVIAFVVATGGAE